MNMIIYFVVGILTLKHANFFFIAENIILPVSQQLQSLFKMNWSAEPHLQEIILWG